MYKVGEWVQLGELNLLDRTSEKRWVRIKKVLLPIEIEGLRRTMVKINQYLSHDGERFSEERIING